MGSTNSNTFSLITRILLIAAIIFGSIIASLLVVYELRYEAPLETPQITEFSFTPAHVSDPDQLILLPVPQQMEAGAGSFLLPEVIRFEAPHEMHLLLNDSIRMYLRKESTAVEDNGSIKVQMNAELPPEGYRLMIRPDGIEIEFADHAGLYYSLITLGQISDQRDGKLPVLEITDWPDLQVRGIMLDISRDKIPTMDTLYEIIDMLALLRYNHLQFYVEGFSFGYPSFEELWEATETPLTGSEIEELSRYASNQMIELVPNHNILGHMSAWLATDRFAHLAECPDGYMLMGLIEHISTLDVSNPESYELVKQMTDDILPFYNSPYFNVNLDEPFELGQCINRDLADERGRPGYLFLDFLKEMNQYVSDEHGHRLMIWGDVAAKHPEILPDIPRDITLIEWGYESIHPFEENVARIDEAGHPFLTAPGTSSWTTFTGRTENMMGNIDSAVDAAVTYGGLGILLTDWGDMGHWQYWPVSWAPITYGSAVSWNSSSREDLPWIEFLNRVIFRDESGVMGQVMLDLGRYNQFEEYAMINMTTTMQTYMFGLMDPVLSSAIQNRFLNELPDLFQMNDEVLSELLSRFENPDPYNHQAIIDYTSKLGEKLQISLMKRDDAKLIIDELTNAIRMIHLGALTRHYVHWMREYDPERKLELLSEMRGIVEEVIEEHQRLWLARNRSGGLNRSLQGFYDLQADIESEVRRQQKGPITQFIGNLSDKLIAAGAALYIGR